MHRRILYCVPNLGGGGTERQLVYLLEELCRRGWNLHVATAAIGPQYERLYASGICIHDFRSLGSHDPCLLWRLYQLIREIRPGIVQTQLRQMDILGGIASLLNRVPFILSERSSAVAYGQGVKDRVRLGVGRHAACVVANSRGGVRYWESKTPESVLKVVIPNILPLEAIAHASGGCLGLPSIPSGSKVLLYVGRLSAEKNLETLLDAFRFVVSQYNVSLLLCGDGELRERIRSLVRVCRLEQRIFLLGFGGDVWGLMKRADALISLSHYEGLPNVVLEARACGCPLVVSDIPAHRELLDERQAVFVDKQDARSVARSLADLLADPGRAKKMAFEAKRGIDSFCAATIVDRYEKLYCGILND